MENNIINEFENKLQELTYSVQLFNIVNDIVKMDFNRENGDLFNKNRLLLTEKLFTQLALISQKHKLNAGDVFLILSDILARTCVFTANPATYETRIKIFNIIKEQTNNILNSYSLLNDNAEGNG